MDSGRQFTNSPFGSPASSAFSSRAASTAAVLFHGGGLAFMRAAWSVKLGVQTPLQSGNLASAAQSPAFGGGLISGSPAPNAAAAPNRATTATHLRIECCIRKPLTWV